MDLRSTVNGSQFRVAPGDELTYSYTVSNQGPAASTNTVLTTTLDPGVSFVSATPADDCRRSGRSVVCELGTMNAGASVSGALVVAVESDAAADVRATFVASSDQLDRSPGDNTATEFTELFAPPRQVTNLAATGGATYIDLSWRSPVDNGSPITSYELERKTDDGNYELVIPGPGESVTAYRDDQVTTITVYTYRLRAVNADGQAEWSNEPTASVGAPPPPPPPRRSSGSGGGGRSSSSGSVVFTDGAIVARSVAENTVPDPNDADADKVGRAGGGHRRQQQPADLHLGRR